jgi:hypothetical protein
LRLGNEATEKKNKKQGTTPHVLKLRNCRKDDRGFASRVESSAGMERKEQQATQGNTRTIEILAASEIFRIKKTSGIFMNRKTTVTNNLATTACAIACNR